jgi:hypothetical protein
MPDHAPQYISASRRCDLPRFQTQEFFTAWQAGEISYDGGYGRRYTVSLRPTDVLGYIFWSKDFSHFIRHPLFEKLLNLNNAVFHFTINDYPELEPHLPGIEERLMTLQALCRMVGSERVFWRYDPICKYTGVHGRPVITEAPFFRLLPRIAGLGITRCYFSFTTVYAKLRRRPVQFLAFTEEQMGSIATAMLAAAHAAGLTLYNCCNPEILPLVPGIRMAHCVDDEILRATDRFGVHVALKDKPTRSGCGCCSSRDIGSYDPPCGHGCYYCYANPYLPPPSRPHSAL